MPLADSWRQEVTPAEFSARSAARQRTGKEGVLGESPAVRCARRNQRRAGAVVRPGSALAGPGHPACPAGFAVGGAVPRAGTAPEYLSVLSREQSPQMSFYLESE